VRKRHLSVLQVTKSWAGPGSKAREANCHCCSHTNGGSLWRQYDYNFAKYKAM